MTVTALGTELADLTLRLAALRHERTALITSSHTLLAYGIGSQSAEVHDRLADISAEAFAIADRLRTLGHHDQADNALTGWAHTPPRNSPAVVA